MRDYTTEYLASLIPFPSEDANKYTRGRTVIVAGCERYPGAAMLCASAAQRMGAGYVEVFTEKKVVPIIQGYRPSLVVRSWKGKSAKLIYPSSEKKPCSYVLGCGFDSLSEKAKEHSFAILEKAQCPVLIDGGALSYVGEAKGRALCLARKKLGLATVFTPHFGEAQRLANHLSLEFDDEKDLVAKLAYALGGIVVLKSSDVFISNGEDICVITHGPAGLAKAGTGDVLAGMIGALLVQLEDPFDASVLGVVLHADAGTVAAQALTTICTTAEDVIDCLPAAIIDLGKKRFLS